MPSRSTLKARFGVGDRGQRLAFLDLRRGKDGVGAAVEPLGDAMDHSATALVRLLAYRFGTHPLLA